MSGSSVTSELMDECLARHKKERKDLQAEIQKLKHGVPKGDKKKKKEITDCVAELESNLAARHKSELDKFSKADENLIMNSISKEIEAISNSDEASLMNTEQEADEQDDKMGFKFTEVDKKSSKARRRKEKKVLKNKEQEETIREQEIKNLTGPRTVEQNKILNLLSKRNLVLCEIPSDGDCLYSAICDQLCQRGIQTTVKTLRKETAQHLLSHCDEFLPFLIHESTGELYSPAEFAEYCRKVEETSEWGGHTEIRALSDVHRVSVEVLQADGPSVVIGEQFNQSPAIIVTYHKFAYGLGAHYNSVKPVSTSHQTSADR